MYPLYTNFSNFYYILYHRGTNKRERQECSESGLYMRTAKSKAVKFWSKKLCKTKGLLPHLVVMLRRKKAPVQIGCWSQGWGCMHSPVGLNSRIEHHRCGDTWFCRSSSDGKAVPVVTGPHPLPLLPSQLILDSTLNVKETHFCTAVIAEALVHTFRPCCYVQPTKSCESYQHTLLYQWVQRVKS